MTLREQLLSDLSDVFFNTDEFAETATHVATGATFPVIFDESYRGISANPGIIESSSPIALCITTDVSGYSIGDEVTINGISYKIAGSEPDGDMTQLVLARKTT